VRFLISALLLSLLIAAGALGQRKIALTTSKPSYDYGETIEVRLRVWNDGDTSFTVFSSTTCVARILPDTVSFGVACGYMETHLLFNPGDSRTWVWHIVPSAFAYPTFSGRHMIWGGCGGQDSTFFDAPAFFGGPLALQFHPIVPQPAIDSIRASLNATLSAHYAYASGIQETWQVIGFPVDSLADELSHDPRVLWAIVPRYLEADQLIFTEAATPTANFAAFHLYPNFPNPFNPSTTIRYVLPHKSAVRLEVFNLLGQMVAEIVQGVQQEGEHTAEFNASHLPSGMYFCRLISGEHVATMKVLLTK
jgi:hypothetical protein